MNVEIRPALNIRMLESNIIPNILQFNIINYITYIEKHCFNTLREKEKKIKSEIIRLCAKSLHLQNCYDQSNFIHSYKKTVPVISLQ